MRENTLLVRPKGTRQDWRASIHFTQAELVVHGCTVYGAEDAGVVQGCTVYGAEDAKKKPRRNFFGAHLEQLVKRNER